MSKTNGSVHDGHRNRVRDKFRKTGFSGMNPHEVLEMLLFYSIPRKDTNEVAHALIDRFGSLSGVLEATEEQLVQVDGVTANSAILIRMILPLYSEYSKDANRASRLQTPEACGNFLKEHFAGKQKECVTMLCLDGACRVLCVEDICDGDATNVVVNVRRIIETVLKFPKTVAVIISHNHPGGLALPSRDDINATDELKKMLGAMDINLVDHFIVTEDDYVSMASSSGFGSIFK